ncbi:MAG TPA: sugar ABC transporter permease [Caldilineaceae bacterium]|nr:sugar ABC transporter permease [Caldilineaceae bacterium]
MSSIRFSPTLRRNLTGYAFVLPWLVSLIVFTAYPTLASFYFAGTEYTLLNPPRWIGLQNFKVMFDQDPLFWKSVGNTLYYVLLSVPLQLGVGLGLAVLLNAQVRAIGIFRTIYYLPALVPAVAAGLLWYVLLDPRMGLVNAGLELIGLPRLGWLRSPDWAMPGLVLIAIWGGSGSAMLIFLAGLKDIPASLLEAATIDGAGALRRFWHVTLPLLSPTIFFNLLISIIASFQVFATALAVAAAAGGSGDVGPLNALLVYMVLLYRNAFRYFQMGYASAMALVLFLVLVVITLALARSSSLWVYYEGGSRR